MQAWRRGSGEACISMVDVLEALRYVDTTEQVSTSIVIEAQSSVKSTVVLYSLRAIGLRDSRLEGGSVLVSGSLEYDRLRELPRTLHDAVYRLAEGIEHYQVTDGDTVIE